MPGVGALASVWEAHQTEGRARHPPAREEAEAYKERHLGTVDPWLTLELTKATKELLEILDPVVDMY